MPFLSIGISYHMNRVSGISYHTQSRQLMCRSYLLDYRIGLYQFICRLVQLILFPELLSYVFNSSYL